MGLSRVRRCVAAARARRGASPRTARAPAVSSGRHRVRGRDLGVAQPLVDALQRGEHRAEQRLDLRAARGRGGRERVNASLGGAAGDRGTDGGQTWRGRTW